MGPLAVIAIGVGAAIGAWLRWLHSAHFFDLADQPEQLLVVVSEPQSRSLLERIAAEGEKIFYVKAAVEYGIAGE